MTLSVINSNNDFDFVGWVIKTPCLFYFRSVKFDYVKETHMMLVTFGVGENCCSISAQKTTKEIFVKICWQLKTPTRTWKCTRCTIQMSYLTYTSDFPFKNCCKLAKQTETIRNYQKQVWLWLSIVWETHKLTRYQSKEFSYITFLYRTNAKSPYN